MLLDRMVEVKPKAERLSDTIMILQKLQRVGIPKTNPGYKEIQAAMTAWVNSTEAATHTIPIARFGRDAELILPKDSGITAKLNLRLMKGVTAADFAPRDDE
jgi:hypothetical protein